MLSTSTLIICQLALSPCLIFLFFKQFIRSMLKSCAQNCARLFYDTGNYYCMVNTNTLLSWGSLGIVLRENGILFYTFIQNLYLQTNLAVKIFGWHQSSSVQKESKFFLASSFSPLASRLTPCWPWHCTSSAIPPEPTLLPCLTACGAQLTSSTPAHVTGGCEKELSASLWWNSGPSMGENIEPFHFSCLIPLNQQYREK